MKKLYLLLAFMAIVAVSCQKELVDNSFDEVSTTTEVVADNIRSYDEALAIAEEALLLLEDDSTRATSSRKIKRNEGQVVMSPATRSGETSEQPIMYIFNNENNEGFTIIAASKDEPSIIAVTDQGNYTYGVPTGVEPFDLLMEDVANSLIVIPGENNLYKREIENELHREYGPTSPIKWGLGSIYGAYYPDGKAYDEAAAIAQAIMSVYTDFSYVITNPNSPLYGQTLNLDKSSMLVHLKDCSNIHSSCNNTIHDQISTLYLEIGYRLSNGTTISLQNKTRPFSITKTKEVLASFGALLGDVEFYDNGPIVPRFYAVFAEYREDIFIFRGTLDSDEDLIEGGYAHTWLANGFDDYSYDIVEYTKNSLINPSHPDPNGYTETNRESKQDFMLYMNWGYDGIGNGWFHSGCFDMSQRIDDGGISLGGNTTTYDYNFTDIAFFTGFEYPVNM